MKPLLWAHSVFSWVMWTGDSVSSLPAPWILVADHGGHSVLLSLAQPQSVSFLLPARLSQLGPRQVGGVIYRGKAKEPQRERLTFPRPQHQL